MPLKIFAYLFTKFVFSFHKNIVYYLKIENDGRVSL